MSQRTKTNVVERTCDGCGVVKEWDMVGITPAIVEDMTQWFTVIREIWTGDRFEKLLVQACSVACVPAAAVKILLPSAPPEDQELDDIDLGKLRTGGSTIN